MHEISEVWVRVAYQFKKPIGFQLHPGEIKIAITAGTILYNVSGDCSFDLYREKSQFGSLLKKICDMDRLI